MARRAQYSLVNMTLTGSARGRAVCVLVHQANLMLTGRHALDCMLYSLVNIMLTGA